MTPAEAALRAEAQAQGARPSAWDELPVLLAERVQAGEDGAFVVLDAAGKATSETITDLVRGFLDERPHYRIPGSSRAEPAAGPDVGTVPLEQVVGAVEGGLRRLTELTARTRPEAIEAAVQAEVEAVRRAHTFEGLLIAPDDALGRVADHVRATRRQAVADEAVAIRGEMVAAAKAVEARIAESQALVVPRGAPVERAARFAERAEVRLRYAGRPLAELAALYEATPDGTAPEVVAWLEDEAATGWPTLRPRTSEPDDVQALTGLRRAIQARRAARVPAALRRAETALAEHWTDRSRILLMEIERAARR